MITHFLDWLLDRKAYRVVYPNGDRTYRIRRSEANDLSAIFGGKVIYSPIGKDSHNEH